MFNDNEDKFNDLAPFLTLDRVLTDYFGLAIYHASIDPVTLLPQVQQYADNHGGKLVIGIEADKVITGFKRCKARGYQQFKFGIGTYCDQRGINYHMSRIPVKNSHGQSDFLLVFTIEPVTKD